MSWASTIREWFNDLFYSSHTRHLEAEILYLKDELSKARVERDKVQSILNSVNPIVARQQKPQEKPAQSTLPTVKRWTQLQAERQKEIDEDRIKKMAAEQQTKAA